MVEDWKGPLEVIWSNPPPQVGPPKASCPGPSLDGFWISPRMETLQLFWATCASVRSFSQWKVSPAVQREPPVFQFVPIASALITGHHRKEPGSILFTPSIQLFIYIDKVPPKPSLLQVEQWQLFQPFLIGGMLQSFDYTCGLSLNSLRRVHVSCAGGAQNWPQYSRCSLTSLSLLARLCLM